MAFIVLKKRREFILLLILFMLAVFTKIHTINQVTVEDANLYAELSYNLVHNHRYESPMDNAENNITFANLSWSPHTTVPPMYPIIGSVFYILTGNLIIGLKIANILLSALTVILLYMFARDLGLKKNLSIIAALLLMFNSSYFYFTGILHLSEATGIFFIVLGAYLFYLRKENRHYYWLAGLCFGFAAITRYTLGAFLLMFCIHSLIKIIQKQNIKKHISLLFAAAIPVAAWFLRNFLLFRDLNVLSRGAYSPTAYAQRLIYAHKTLLIFGMSAIIILNFLIPVAIYFVWKLVKEKDRNKFYFLTLASACFVSFIVPAVLLSKEGWPFISAAIAMTRYFLPTLPFAILFSFLAIGKIKKKRRNIARVLIGVALIIFIAMTTYSNIPFVKDRIDIVFPVYEMRTQTVYHFDQATRWININADKDSVASYYTEKRMFDHEKNYYVFNLRKGINYIHHSKLTNNVKKFYFISTSLTDFKFEKDKKIIDFESKKVFETKFGQKFYVFEIDVN